MKAATPKRQQAIGATERAQFDPGVERRGDWAWNRWALALLAVGLTSLSVLRPVGGAALVETDQDRGLYTSRVSIRVAGIIPTGHTQHLKYEGQGHRRHVQLRPPWRIWLAIISMAVSIGFVFAAGYLAIICESLWCVPAFVLFVALYLVIPLWIIG